MSEWINLRWGDVHEGPEGRWFEYRVKGGGVRRQVIPPGLWRVVQGYLERSGRWRPGREACVFVAHSDAARRLGCVGEGYDPAERPLSARRVNALLKK